MECLKCDHLLVLSPNQWATYFPDETYVDLDKTKPLLLVISCTASTVGIDSVKPYKL